MKAGLYWSYSTRSLARGGQRTLLAMFCVAVGVLAIVALQLVGNMVNNGLTSNVREGNGGDISFRSDITPLTQPQLSFFSQLQQQGEITTYTYTSDHNGQSDATDNSTQYYQLRAVDPGNFPLVGAPTFQSPSNASISSLLTGNNVVVTSVLLNDLKAKVGDTIAVTSDDGRHFDGKIAGEIASTGFFRRAQMLVARDYYAGVNSSSGRPIAFNGVYSNVPGHTDANAAKAQADMEKQFPAATITTTKDALQQNQSQVQNIRYFLQVVGLLALLIGGVGIINTMQVLLRRRQTEIAMLKTAGYQRTDLYMLFGLEAGLLGLAGGVIGALAGVGVSFLVKGLVETAFNITLPTAIDPGTVLWGVAIGFFTALIFGLMPIVQASQVRPLAVLRGLSEGTGGESIVLTIILSVLLVVLFFLLAWTILGTLFVAIGVVAGTGIFLVLLSLFFALVVFIVGKLPVPERITLPFALLVVVALLVAIGITYFAPAFGILFIVIAALGFVVGFLPREWKSNVKMALRNIDRQRVRTITTMIALFVGVFAIGLILVLGQNIKDQINQALSTQVKYNSFVIAGPAAKPQVDTELSKLGVSKSDTLVNVVAQGNPVAVNGKPLAQVLAGVPKNSSATRIGRDEAVSYISSIQGWDLAGGSTPASTGATLASGSDLTAADANTNNVILPARARQSPLSLSVGSTITLASPDGKTVQTLTVIGFYSNSFGAGGMYGDNSAANKVAGGQPFYVYQLRLDPTKSDQTLHSIEKAAPTVQTFSLIDLALFINTLLNNLIILLTAVASLAMLAGLIIIANAVALAMLERRRELGILKSVGYTSRSVLSEVLIENGTVGFLGALLAMLLVLLAMLILGKVVFKIDLSVGIPIVLITVGATAAVCMVVAGIVAWSATRVRPLEVLRYE